MRALSSGLRNQLEAAVVTARRAAESASRIALGGLGVFADRRPDHLDAERSALRNGLRAKWRQLGDDPELLVTECAYEQWHRLLFARFLAENHLLIHPQYGAEVSLEDCEELANELQEPDGWSVAARFAAEILPGIFRRDDPCVRLRLAPEGRDALERILAGLPIEVFAADDSLGWVYQFWQKDKKNEVNASERKVGGADLGPVTQLFTENYMVRFLLENSLGAWWTARHPESKLVESFSFLRLDESGRPAVGRFDSWPDHAAEITLMDPCCGSGHFLVEAFSLLWPMRAEEEHLTSVEAQDAVLRDNLFGLELDSRCVQIAMFAIAFQAWRTSGGWRRLPVPNVGCSGTPVKASVDDWKALAGADVRLQNALLRLHALFQDADTLGSLIDPVTNVMRSDDTHQASLDDVDWKEAAGLVDRIVGYEDPNSEQAALNVDVTNVSRAAALLARTYTLVATNVPFLSRGKQSNVLQQYIDRYFAIARADLATAMLLRWLRTSNVAVVTPQHWHAKVSYQKFRRWVLTERQYRFFARLGNNVWQTQSGGQPFKVPTVLSILVAEKPQATSMTSALDIGNGPIASKARDLRACPLNSSLQAKQMLNVECRIVTVPFDDRVPMLSDFADCYQGTSTGDNVRYCRNFWELPAIDSPWRRWQSSVVSHVEFGGREQVVLWEGEAGVEHVGAAIRGRAAWGRRGMAISQMGSLYTTQYSGDLYDNNVAALIPKRDEDLPAIRSYVSSAAFAAAVRGVDQSVKVEVATLPQVPFDIDRWRSVAEKAGPLPQPSSDDPTQWPFDGRISGSTTPLHVAVARLLGYSWPGMQGSDGIESLSDTDGIACLPSVAGEEPAAARVLRILATAFGPQWVPETAKRLLERAGSKRNDLGEWLRDEFFKQHCALFGYRPFIWHVWDGQRDGFSALVNYHRLNRKLLEKLVYTYLGKDWVERQRAGVRDDVPGAEERLEAALVLQRKLEVILAGEKPYDIYVRWKALHEQPVGWDPDLSDGVRFNIRPFVQAGVLRAHFNINWNNDRGLNPDGSDRANDLHKSLAEKRAARITAWRA